MFYFYTPWKRHKTFSFLTLSEGIEMEHSAKIGEVNFSQVIDYYSP